MITYDMLYKILTSFTYHFRKELNHLLQRTTTTIPPDMQGSNANQVRAHIHLMNHQKQLHNQVALPPEDDVFMMMHPQNDLLPHQFHLQHAILLRKAIEHHHNQRDNHLIQSNLEWRMTSIAKGTVDQQETTLNHHWMTAFGILGKHSKRRKEFVHTIHTPIPRRIKHAMHPFYQIPFESLSMKAHNHVIQHQNQHHHPLRYI